MATEKKYKATIEIGGAIASSLKSSFAAVTGNTKALGASLSKLTSQQRKLEGFNSAQLRIGETQKKLMQAMKAGDTSGVERLRKSLDTQRQSLTKLGEELKKAKIDTGNLSGEMERLGRKADATRKVMDSWSKIKPIGDNFKTVATRTAGGFVAVGAAAAAASAGVWKLGTAFGNFADSAAEGAATLGTDANFLLSVRYAASQVGASAEMADKALSEMNIRLVDAGEDGNKTGEALSELGLDIGKLQKLDTASQFATISQAFSKYSGSVNKAKIATDIFGKSGRKIPNLLNLGKEGLQGYAQAAKDAGYLLSDSDMLMGDAFDEAMGQFNLALEGSRNIIGRELLPILTELMTSLGSFIRENAPNIKAVAQEFGGWLKTNGPIIGGQIRDMAKSLVEMGKAAWPFIESIGGVKAVLTGIATIAFLPTIAAIGSLAASFITAVPAVIKLTTGLWAMATAGWAAIAPLLPIIGTVAVVAAGVVALGFAVKHVADNWDTWSWALNEAWTATKEFFAFIGTGLSNFGAATKEFASSFYSVIVGAFDGTNKAAMDFLGFLGQGLSNFGTAFGQFGTTIYKGISGAFGGALAATTGFVASMGGAIGGWVSTTTMAISDFGGSIYASIAGSFSGAWTATTGFIANMGSAIGGWVSSTMASISGLGASIYDSIAGAFDRLTGKISQWFGWVKEKFASLGSSIAGVFTGGEAPAPVDGARAAGGPVSAGKNYLVGERGPEIFSPSSSGSIIPNHRTGGSVSNDNRTITINITASPGMNERTLADLVLARLDGRQAALAGGALYD